MTDLDGLVATYLESRENNEDRDEYIEKLIQKWEEWKAEIKWDDLPILPPTLPADEKVIIKLGQSIPKLPFDENERNYLNSRVIDGLYELDEVRRLDMIGVWTTSTHGAYRWMCQQGHLESAKWIYAQLIGEVDSYGNDLTFLATCRNGHLEVVKWLMSLRVIDTETIYKGFLQACEKGKLEVAQFLKTTFDLNDTLYRELAFQEACHHGHIETAKWLYSLGLANATVGFTNSIFWCLYYDQYDHACARIRLIMETFPDLISALTQSEMRELRHVLDRQKLNSEVKTDLKKNELSDS